MASTHPRWVVLVVLLLCVCLLSVKGAASFHATKGASRALLKDRVTDYYARAQDSDRYAHQDSRSDRLRDYDSQPRSKDRFDQYRQEDRTSDRTSDQGFRTNDRVTSRGDFEQYPRQDRQFDRTYDSQWRSNDRQTADRVTSRGDFEQYPRHDKQFDRAFDSQWTRNDRVTDQDLRRFDRQDSYRRYDASSDSQWVRDAEEPGSEPGYAPPATPVPEPKLDDTKFDFHATLCGVEHEDSRRFDGHAKKGGHYAYVWTGCSNLPDCKDYVAVVDLFPGSPTCGKVTYKAYIPLGGVEAHHFGIVNGGKGMAAGGFLDFALKTPSWFFFDLSDPAKPKYLNSTSTPRGGAADDVAVLPDGGFLVTMMGGKDGGTPGVVSRFDSEYNLVGEYPPEGEFEYKESFNPHGIGIAPDYGVFVTADFFQPNTAAPDSVANIEFRKTVRLWDLETFELKKTFFDPNANGFLDTKIMGSKPYAVFENGIGEMYMLNLQEETFHHVYTLPKDLLPHFTVFFSPYADGDRLFVAVWETRWLMLFNTTNPMKPEMIDMYRFHGMAENPHTVSVSDKGGEVLVAVSNYFLSRPELKLKVDLPGDQSVHFFKIIEDRIVPVDVPPLQFSSEEHYGNPHHVILSYVE